ncbi:MAG: MBL fold metallo-hydrolase [Desulfobacteraceae bacterium]|jgi:7,8-dihydropterin-6-yl-methyl-4-(beta-D-ribofuranosyl)aminobenzene 5'-phosphate synthase
MTPESIQLHPVDQAEIVILVDNYADVLLGGSDQVSRAPVAPEGRIPADTLLAEHGLSMLVRTMQDGQTREVLLDAGYSPVGLPHNLDLLGISLDGVEAIVLSHGHMDHNGALDAVLERIPGSVSLVAHPDAFLENRYLAPPEGPRQVFPQNLDRSKLEGKGAVIQETASPTALAGGTVLVTGQVPRTTPYEKGMATAFLERDGREEKDDILDDQSLVLNVRGKGLVVVAGCSHAGIVNTVQYAVDLTGEKRVHAVLGGFHLTGDLSGELTEKTIEGLKGFEPAFLMPMHCTGWKAVHRISEAFPSAFALSAVGTTVTL